MAENDEDVGIENELIDLNDKISDLRSVKDQTAEQKAELAELVEKRKTRSQKRIDLYAGRAKAAEERARKAEEKALELEGKFTAAEKRLPFEKASHQKVKFDGDEFYTDASLRAMVSSGEMTEDDAWAHQEERRVAAAADRISKKNEKQTFESTRNKTISDVLGEYPQLNPQHPKYDPKDPLTAEVDRLLRNGYQFKPDGLRNAVDDAKRFLRLDAKKPDLSEEFGITRDGAAGQRTESKREIKVDLLDWEAENAVRMYVNTGQVNLKTGKPYTKAEAIEKALLAKKNRATEMAAR